MVTGKVDILGGHFDIPYWVVGIFIAIYLSPCIFLCLIAFNFLLSKIKSEKPSKLEIVIPVLVLINIILYSLKFGYPELCLSFVFYIPIIILLTIIKICFAFNHKTNTIIILSYILFFIIYNYYSIFLGADPLSYNLFN